MRRVRSAPANICSLSHQKVKEKIPQKQMLVPSRTSRIIQKGDALDQMVTSSLQDVHIEDPTEQLVLLIILRKVLLSQKTQVNIKDTMYELFVRMVVSFTTQKLMACIILSIHSHHIFTDVQTILNVPRP